MGRIKEITCLGVNPKETVIQNARGKNVSVHFASLVDLWHLSHAGRAAHLQTWKVCVVLRGEQCQGSPWLPCSVLQRLKQQLQNSWIQCRDYLAWLENRMMQYQHAHKKTTKGRVPRSTVWIRLPRNRRPQEWDDIEEPVVLVEVHLHGDPMAGLLWERKLEDILPKTLQWKSAQLGMPVIFIAANKYVAVQVGEMNMVGKKENATSMWEHSMTENRLGRSFTSTQSSSLGMHAT